MRLPLGCLAAVLVPLAFVRIVCEISGRERAESQRLARAALGRLREGMPLSEAEEALSDAWYHAACPYYAAAGGSAHLFLYRSRDLDMAGIVYIGTRGAPEQQVVNVFRRIDTTQYDRLEWYRDCFPSNFRPAAGRASNVVAMSGQPIQARRS